MNLSLTVRIFGCFMLNLGLIACVLYLFFGSFLSVETMITGQSGIRLKSLSDQIGQRLKSSSVDNWDAVLDEFSEEYELQDISLKVYFESGLTLEGEPVPDEISEVFTEHAHPRPPLRRQASNSPRQGGAPPRAGNRRNSNLPSNFVSAPPLTVQLLFARKDKGYWYGSRLIMGPGMTGWPSNEPRHSVILVIHSATKDGNGVIYDATPLWKIGGSLLLVCLIVWVPFTWSLTRYIKTLKSTTETIARGDFSVRTSRPRGDELGQLGAAIDVLAERLDGFVIGQKRFLGDIAHELCGPLSRVQITLGLLENSPEKSPSKIASLREEAELMNTMVEELLDFSRASLSPDKVEFSNVLLKEISDKVIEREGAVAAENRIPDGLTAKVNPHLFQRALSNVVRNCLRHAGANGDFIITAEQKDGKVLMHIDDNGPGIPKEHLARIFDPFYRVDDSRTRETGGAGLGLAIVQTCLEASQAQASCSNRPQGGLRVTFYLQG